jgi:hypothetical protein
MEKLKVGVPMVLEPGIKEQLAALAAERESNLSDVAVSILAEHFKFPYESSGIKRRSLGPTRYVELKMPPRLRELLKNAIDREHRRLIEAGRQVPLGMRNEMLNSIFREYFSGDRAAVA